MEAKRSTSQVGASFSEIVQLDSFVDNTMFIYDFLYSYDYAELIIAPERSGKSINMDMLKTFLEIETDEDGLKVTDNTKTKNYQLFTEQPEGKQLKISEKKEFMKHLGQYPVIYVNFSSITGNDFEEMLNQIKNAINTTFQQHMQTYAFLLKKNIEDHNKCCKTTYCTKGKDINFLEKLINDERIEVSEEILHFKKFYNNEKNLTECDLICSLEFLCEMLHEHFKKEVIVLIDEYDTPMNFIKDNGSETDALHIYDFIEMLLGRVMKGNAHVERGLMTGTALTNRFPYACSLNNVSVHKIVDNDQYAKYFKWIVER